jgi:hypothetical protein
VLGSRGHDEVYFAADQRPALAGRAGEGLLVIDGFLDVDVTLDTTVTRGDSRPGGLG